MKAKTKSIRVSVLLAAAVASSTVASVEAAGTALAAPTGTAMVNTQRMSDATLTSTQNGWYTKGTSLALTCYKHGQSVKGFYSAYVGNGGWDDLWYKVSDGYYVADIDINTGANNPVTPACSTTQPSTPAASSAKADHAIQWANSMVGSDSYNSLCLKFVANAYGKTAAGYNTALDMYNTLKSQGQIHTSGTAPNGALVFSKSSYDGGAGHVDLARSDGKFVSGGVSTSYGTHHTVQVLNSSNPSPGATYLGWAEVPSSWPGR